jgi:DNA-binding beta-propeller fold protein YncE
MADGRVEPGYEPSFEIPLDAPREVHAALARIGAEDVSFSPSNQRLALACLPHNTIAIADIAITLTADRPRVTMTKVVEYTSPHLDAPHGLEFLDDDTLIVASRGGSIALLQVVSDSSTTDVGVLRHLALPHDADFQLISKPGSVFVRREEPGIADVLVCNIWNQTVTRHRLQLEPLRVTQNEVLVSRWLDAPDGGAVSPDDQWIAVSNHDTHSVFIYRRSPCLDLNSEPDCILRGVLNPHGVRFSADSRHLLVADAAKPLLHVYAQDGFTWHGVHAPVGSLRVMDDEVFQKARDAQSGGPKGVDFDRDGRVVAVTFEKKPVTFFDSAGLLEHGARHAPDDSQLLTYELEVIERTREKSDRRIAKLTSSGSFRVTRPLRWCKTKLTGNRQ